VPGPDRVAPRLRRREAEAYAGAKPRFAEISRVAGDRFSV
jgi:hypothetical protein